MTVLDASSLGRRSYFLLCLLIFAVVVYGFGQTIDSGLIHPDYPLPPIIYVHAAVFGGWIALLLAQSYLVQAKRVLWHKKLGLAGLAWGTVLPIVGVATKIVMSRFAVAHHDATDGASMALSFNDMIQFSIAFGLAMWWRKRPDRHRRLVLLATCALTGAAFARFPESLVPEGQFYVAVDGLLALCALRDVVMDRRIHPVYMIGIPAMILGQRVALYLLGVAAWAGLTRQLLS